MGPTTAANVRRLGLIVEAVCMLGILSLARRNAAEPELVLGVPLYRVFQAGLACGLVLWFVGTIAYRRAQQKGDL
ncbi:MAG: hypothetical protein P4L84_14235 [Isosphaeraceae bacterium]|nr:hypothetical protein [Isosphaeraceae bacterium]